MPRCSIAPALLRRNSLLLALPSSSCGDPAPSSSPQDPAPGGDLLRHLDQATWRAADPTSLPVPPSILLAAEAAGSGSDDFRVLPGERGLFRKIPLQGRESVTVTLHARALAASPIAAPGANEVPAGLVLRALSEAGTDSDQRPARPQSTVFAAHDRWQEVDVRYDLHPGATHLLLGVLPGPVGVEVTDLEVRGLSLAQATVGAVQDASQLFRRQRMEPTQVDSLVLPPGGSVQFRVAVPAARPRLDLDLALVTGPAGGGATLEVLVNGERVAEERLYAGSAVRQRRFTPRVIGLGDHASRTVDLALRCRSEHDTLLYLGAPTLLGGTTDPGPSVVILSLDTLRADALGAYGATPSATPAMDRLAAEGTVFEQTFAGSSYTLPTHASMLTGQGIPAHGVIRPPDRLDPERSALLARMLHQQGFRTAAFTGSGYLHPDFGFDVGFQRFTTHDPGRRPKDADAESGLQPVLQWLERHADQRFFLFVHSYLIHNYDPGPAFWDEAANPCPESWQGLDPDQLRDEAVAQGDPELVRYLHARYRATVRQADQALVAPLLETLDRLELTPRTLVVLVSDHGEEFQEHGGFWHGHALWNELVHVPWILRGPGVPAGRRIVAVTHLQDLAPTLLELLEVPLDPRMTGLAVLGPSEERAPVERPPVPLHLERTHGDGVHRWDGLVQGPWKLLRRHGAASRSWLFRWDQDPQESVDRMAEQPALAERLENRLLDLLRAMSRTSEGLAPAAMDEETRKNLERLGYVDR